MINYFQKFVPKALANGGDRIVLLATDGKQSYRIVKYSRYVEYLEILQPVSDNYILDFEMIDKATFWHIHDQISAEFKLFDRGDSMTKKKSNSFLDSFPFITK